MRCGTDIPMIAKTFTPENGIKLFAIMKSPREVRP